MLTSFLAWLRDYVIKAGIVGLTKGTLGILAFGGLLSALFGATTIKSGVIVAVIVGILGLYILLIASLIELRRSNDLNQQLLSHYLDILRERQNPSWRITHWEQFSDINANGDSNDATRVAAVVESEHLDFFSIRTGSGRKHTARERRKISILLRTMEVGGIGGSRFKATSNWISDSRLEVLAHFKDRPRRGDAITMVITQDWPRKSATLVRDNEPDEFTFEFRHPISYLKHTIALPAGRDPFIDLIGLVHGKHEYSLESHTNNFGRVEVTLTAYDIPEDLRVGMRLDLKPRSASNSKDAHSVGRRFAVAHLEPWKPLRAELNGASADWRSPRKPG